MKNTNTFCLFVIPAFFILSCRPDDEIIVNEKLLPGVWRLEHVTFNEVDGKTINDWISTSSTLVLGKDSSYYQNFVRGEWLLNGNKIILDPEEGFVGFEREYELLEISNKTLKLKFAKTDRQYCCDFDQFQDDEVLTIIETYRRDDEL